MVSRRESSAVSDVTLSRLVLALGRLGRMLRQQRSEDLSWSVVSLLLNIGRLQPVTATRLAQAEGVAPPSLNRTLKCLADRGLVERADHPEDGRMVLVSLSAEGERERVRVRRRREAWLSQSLARLDDDERSALLAALPVLERLGRDEAVDGRRR